MQPTEESTLLLKRGIVVALIILPLFSGLAAFTNILGIHDSRTSATWTW